ncbi:glycosyltransferase [Janthinobacterium sp. MDT1-19]|uniref:glycosyltransferase n=1 Tax=Janthinobacterium sp. MDT1-19 TaxID=1259339 RepID=UPI003F1FEE69
MSSLNSSSDRPLTSVLIPLYNHALYIVECLDSVLAQGPANIELVLIDDGSSDDGFSIAQRWKEEHGNRFPRIEFERQVNAGITQTYDRLLRKSTGNVILVVASDDVLMPESIISRLSLLGEPGVMAVFADAIPIDGQGKVTGTSAISELGQPSSRAALADQRTLPWELIFRWNVYGSVLLYRREAVLKPDGNSVLNLDIFSEDMQLYYLFGSRGSLRYLNQPVAKYRVHGTNTSHTQENVKKLRKNIYQSRRHAMIGMPFWRRAVVAMQAFTYHRWGTGWRKRLCLPMVAFAYMGILTARLIYDFYRTRVLRQARDV